VLLLLLLLLLRSLPQPATCQLTSTQSWGTTQPALLTKFLSRLLAGPVFSVLLPKYVLLLLLRSLPQPATCQPISTSNGGSLQPALLTQIPFTPP
jgi:hypothetical protein